MTDYADLLRADNGQTARPIQLVAARGLADWLAGQPPRLRATVAAQRFEGKPGSHAILPGNGEDWSVVAGVADPADLSPWCLAKLADALPEGVYRLAQGSPGAAMLGWLTAHYDFGRYRSVDEDRPVQGPRVLLTGEVARIPATVRLATATARVRDMVNTGAADMGPEAIEAIAGAIAAAGGGTLTVTRGDALAQGFPLIHAVGRAAGRAHAPRLIEVEWGDPAHPRVAIIGKGVTFDSGGLDIKSATGMRLMKKDMGGAAHALALAELIIAEQLPVRLHCLVPAVENAIDGDAFRPGDVIRSRKGITVEIDNTDAEGRLVLADAFTRAIEEGPELMIDFATLTGAARVALGPDLPALFSRDDGLAEEIAQAGRAVDDPVWRMPLWTAYDDMLSSDIADTANSGGGLAGAITAALFLAKFVPDEVPWVHLDTFAWRPAARPGRPKGGDALSLRAVWRVLEQRYRPA